MRQVEARGKALPASPGCHGGRALQDWGLGPAGGQGRREAAAKQTPSGRQQARARAGERTPREGRGFLQWECRPEGLRLKAVTVGQVTGTHLMASPGGRGRSKVMEGGNWEDWLQRKGLRA